MIAIRIEARGYHGRPFGRSQGKRVDSADGPTIWLVDPISYTGMAYTDAAQCLALEALGASVLLAGSDEWMLAADIIRRRSIFRGTSGRRNRARKGVAYLLSLVRLVRAVRVARPDIVHWQYTELPLADLAAMAVLRLLGRRQVYTAHEVLPWTSRRHHLATFKALYALVDAVIVHDQERRAELVTRFGADPSRVRVIPLGDYAPFVDAMLPQASARQALRLPRDRLTVLFFGAIRPSKGLDVLLDAWPRVTQAIGNSVLVIAGKPFKGLDTRAITARIEADGQASSVITVFRQVSPAEANNYYRAADVVVLPYHAIGTSGVLRYAYNAARAVVATSVGEHVVHVIPGQTGMLVDPGNATGLANALVDCLSDVDRLERMGVSGAAYAATHFSWGAVAHSMLGLYNELVSQPARKDQSSNNR